MAERVPISLVCTECEARNYRTTRKAGHTGQISIKKFCPACKKHTVHKESK